MKRLLTLPVILMTFEVFGQVVVPLDTVDQVVFGEYPTMHKAGQMHLVDSIENAYPNRLHVHFEGVDPTMRDNIVRKIWVQFYNDFNASVDFSNTHFARRKNHFFFTLFFDQNGSLTYIFFNWTKTQDHVANLTEQFKRFAANYDYSGFPKGENWSQCGTFTFDRKQVKILHDGLK